MQTATTSDLSPRDRILACASELGLTMTAEFVPLSQSRNANETFQGKPRRTLNWRVKSAGAILPDFADVLYGLSSDASVLDSPCYEDWASEFGYEPDSRKGEAIYRACLGIALKLRAAIGEAGLEALRSAAQDY